jgi:hypothetical protein
MAVIVKMVWLTHMGDTTSALTALQVIAFVQRLLQPLPKIQLFILILN